MPGPEFTVAGRISKYVAMFASQTQKKPRDAIGPIYGIEDRRHFAAAIRDQHSVLRNDPEKFFLIATCKRVDEATHNGRAIVPGHRRGLLGAVECSTGTDHQLAASSFRFASDFGDRLIGVFEDFT